MSASKKEQPVPAEWNFDFIHQQFGYICTKYVMFSTTYSERNVK